MDFSTFIEEELGPSDLKKLRHNIGCSISEMADFLGLRGSNAANSLRKMECGRRPISGTIQNIVRFSAKAFPDEERGPHLRSPLPKFLIGLDLEGDYSVKWVFHTQYPRFLARTMTKAETDILALISPKNIKMLIYSILDSPVKDPQDILLEASAYLRESKVPPLMKEPSKLKFWTLFPNV